jgi:LysM repeat protein
MSSGVRFTVAVIVVALFAIGLYYARLEKPAESGPDDVTRMADPSPATADPTPPPVVREPTPEPSDRIVPEPSAPVEDDEEAEETAPPDDPATGLADGDPAEPLEVAPSETIEPEVVTPPSGLARSYGPSLGVRETGVSLLSAVPLDDERVDQESALTSLRNSGDAGRPAGVEGTVWLPLASWNTIRGSGEIEGLVVGTRGSEETEEQFLLLRDDSIGGLRLDGRIAGATVREDAEGRPEVAYLLESDAVDEVREATFGFVGGTVAWVVDGEIVSTPTLRIAIQNRGQIMGGFDREDAAWIAARLRGELMAKPGTVVEEANEETPLAEAPSASGLPAEAYTPYTIQSGDNFESIAESWFGDPRKQSLIALANPTVDPVRLQVGQVIKLPPKNSTATIRRANPTSEGVVIHTVQSGETLSDISLEYYGKASRWREIHDANLAVIGDDPGNLRVGMEIVIP